MDRPLEDINVIDLSQALAGPYSASLLADFGADVVHIEPPGGGTQREMLGQTLPPNVERNKRSIIIDLKKEDALEILEPIIEDGDVLIHNYRPGKMEALGFGFDSLRRINDNLIYCSITGYGNSGPLKDRPAFDPLLQAQSGLMAQTGEPDSKPSRVGTSVIDFGVGTYAAYAILLALRVREQTGEAQKIETSLYDTAAAFMGYWYTYVDRHGETPERLGHTWWGYQPIGTFDTIDKPIHIAVAGEKLWVRFCKAIDKEEWLNDSRFSTQDDRVENWKQLHGLIAAEFKEYTRDELIETLVEKGVPAAELQTVKEAANDSHLLERGTITQIEDQDGANVKAVTNPIRLSKTPSKIETNPPSTGEHTREILLEYGFNNKQIELLEEEGVIESDDN